MEDVPKRCGPDSVHPLVLGVISQGEGRGKKVALNGAQAVCVGQEQATVVRVCGSVLLSTGLSRVT